MKYPRTFSPLQISSLHLRNRIAMAPMTRRKAAEDGIPTDEITAYYRRRAAHEVGLIISEGTAIDNTHAFDTKTVPRFVTNEQIAGWRHVVEAVHEEGGAFAPQLWHCGRLAENPIGPMEDTPPPKPDGTPRPTVRPMEAADFDQVLAAYKHSAQKAKEIGCDALEIHGAHGYLLDSFLSETTNQRNDLYGGSVENRMRFPLQVVDVVREAVGPDFPIIYRFSQWKVDDYREIKFKTPSDLETWVRALVKHGVDILHVSTRNVLDPGFADHGEKPLAVWTQELSGLPTIGVGSIAVTLPMDQTRSGVEGAISDPSPALALLEDGSLEMLAVGRSLIANPDWVPQVREGHWKDLAPYSHELLEELV